MIQLKEYDIELDLKTKEVKYYDFISKQELKEIEVVRGDYQTNKLNISLISGGQPYLIGDNTVDIAFKKHDNTVVLMEYADTNLVVTDNIIKILLTTNITAISGRQVVGEVIVKGENGEVLTSRANFYFRVHRGILTDEAIASTNELPLLNRLIDQVEELDTSLTANEAQRIITFNGIVDTADTTKTGLDASIVLGDTLKGNLDTLVTNGNTTTSNLQDVINDSVIKKNALDDSVTTANTTKSNLDGSISNANIKNGELINTIGLASTSKTNLDDSITLGDTTKTGLDGSISTGQTLKDNLDSFVLDGAVIGQIMGITQPTKNVVWLKVIE